MYPQILPKEQVRHFRFRQRVSPAELFLLALQLSKMITVMIEPNKIDELLKLPAEERRRVLRLLQESLPGANDLQGEAANSEQTSPAAKWLLSMAGRFTGGPGNTAGNADEILRAEIDGHNGFSTK